MLCVASVTALRLSIITKLLPRVLRVGLQVDEYDAAYGGTNVVGSMTAPGHFETRTQHCPRPLRSSRDSQAADVRSGTAVRISREDERRLLLRIARHCAGRPGV